jgi:hypothetical protein
MLPRQSPFVIGDAAAASGPNDPPSYQLLDFAISRACNMRDITHFDNIYPIGGAFGAVTTCSFEGLE